MSAAPVTKSESRSSTQGDENQQEKIPDLDLAQWTFLLGRPEYDPKLKGEILKNLMVEIEKYDMSHFYREAAANVGIPLDQALLNRMEEKNKQKLSELDAAIKDAEENLGETEVRDANFNKAVYLCRIGDKSNAISALKKTYEKTIGVGRKLDLVFFMIRIGLFYSDHQLITTHLAKAKYLMEQGGDWDRKNRLKAYEGLYCLSVRDFKKAADLFLDSSSTFTSTELMTYEQLVFYSVISSILALDRIDIREKVIKGAEIQEQLHIQKEVRDYLTSLYDCNYAEFFVGLNNMEPRLKYDRFLAPHYIYYCRAMRTKAYKQLISSYSSINLKYIAELFNVTEEYIDKEFHQLIATGQLSCKIDGVSGVVETSQADTHTQKYTEFVKHSDILLNRIQKLSHVINN